MDYNMYVTRYLTYYKKIHIYTITDTVRYILKVSFFKRSFIYIKKKLEVV